MAEPTQQWEYKVLTVGTWMGVTDGDLETRLNELGQEGWEVLSAQTPYGSAKVRVVARRPLSATVRRQRTWPQ